MIIPIFQFVFMIKFSILFVKFYLRIFANKSIHKTFAGGCLSRCFLLAAGTGDPVRTREIAADESAGAGTHGVLTLRVLCRRAFNDAAEKPADGRGGCQAALGAAAPPANGISRQTIRSQLLPLLPAFA